MTQTPNPITDPEGFAAHAAAEQFARTEAALPGFLAEYDETVASGNAEAIAHAKWTFSLLAERGHDIPAYALPEA